MKNFYLLLFTMFFYFLAHSENYAIFIPDNEDTNIYNKETGVFSKEIAKRYLSSFLNLGENKSISFYDRDKLCSAYINRRGYYFYQEKGGEDYGRRALFKNIKSYSKVFVFENNAKFESYSNYKEFKEYAAFSRLKFERISQELNAYEKWPKNFKISLALNAKELRNKYVEYWKIVNGIADFKFHFLDNRYAIFCSKKSSYRFYNPIEKGIFDLSQPKYMFNIRSAKILLKRIFGGNVWDVSEFSDIEVDDLQFVSEKKRSIDKRLFGLSFYQEGGRAAFGFHRLFNDVKNKPYKFKIILLDEEEEEFNKRFPNNYLGTFEIC
ncbi:MAG: hypothetical protein ABIF12_02350 [bacterium]